MAKTRYYFDEMMPRPVANQLTKMGIDVVMAVDVDMTEQEDSSHLTYATERSMVLVTADRPFAGVSSRSSEHAGLICWLGSPSDYGGLVRALVAFANEHTSEAAAGRVFWLK